jgi:hypothetical protein
MARQKKIDTAALLERFGDLNDEEVKDTEPWIPSLSKTQRVIFDDSSKYIMAYGERGTGKTYILGGHKLVRHCYENFNALALCVVGVKSQATMGGVWHKLQTEVLPLWADGLGINITEERQDAQKNLYIDVQNRYGGYSRIVVISVPYGAFIRDRIKGFEPSYVFIDELTNLDTEDYFNAVVQQIGRRPGIRGPQQYTAACNPAGPSHWVYKRFFEVPYRNGDYNDDYSVYHLKIEENKHNLPDGYYDRVKEAVANDSIEEARMIRGEWIDRPLGEAIFRPYFIKNIHIVGDKKRRILPNPDYPIICGWDPGSVNNAVIFLQCLAGADKTIWTCFDELVWINEKLPYTTIVPLIMRRMRYWNNRMDTKFTYEHISDNSAFNQFRAKTGSYDVKDIQNISADKADSFEMDPIRMKAAPKFSGSVESRVRILTAKLQKEEFMVSSSCSSIIKMFHNLVAEKGRDGKYDPSLPFKPKRSIYIHPFDALTYPMIYYGAGAMNPSSRMRSEIIEVGA